MLTSRSPTWSPASAPGYPSIRDPTTGSSTGRASPSTANTPKKIKKGSRKFMQGPARITSIRAHIGRPLNPRGVTASPGSIPVIRL